MKRFIRTEYADTCHHPQRIARQIAGGKSEPSLMLASLEPGPIYRLAPELVQAIFEQTHRLVLPVEAGFFDKQRVRPSALAIKLSHVCNLWRNIALATPSLWTFIDRFHDDYDFVKLSQNHLLHLALEAYPKPALPFPAWLQNCSGRTHSIMAEGPADTIHGLLQHVGRSFPELESLEIRAVDEAYGRLEEIDAPKLKRLILDRALLSNFSTLSNLTHLTLHGLLPQYAYPSGRDIIDLLRRCPQLKALCLYELDLSRTSAGDDSTRAPKVVLTHLETMRMHGLSTATAGYLSSRIQVPTSAPLFIKCDAAPSGNDGFWLEIDLDHGGHIALGVSKNSPHYSVSTFPHDLQVRSGFLRKGLDFSASAFDLSTVASLKLMVPPTLSASDRPALADWHTLFSRMPALSALAISMPLAWIETFICALCDQEDALVCPRLSGLSILDVNQYTGNCELVAVVHSHLQIRVRNWGAMLNVVRIHRGYNRNLNWGDVTRIYDPNYTVDDTTSTPPRLVAMTHF